MADLEPIIESVDGTPVGISGGGGGGTPDDNSVTTAKIVNGAVTSAKLAAAVAGAGLTGGAGTALAVGVGDGITVNANDVAAKVSDFAGAGLEDDGANNLRIAAAAAGDGLTGGAGSALAVGAGTGITVNANDVAVDTSVIATRAYADALTTGLDVKASVRAASTANLNLASMPAAIDDVTLANGESFLAKNQSTGSQNGIYIFNGAGVAATRRTDADANAEVTSGLYTFVSEGTANGGTGWFLSTADPITVGTTALVFSQFSGPGTYTNGTGLGLTGTVFSVLYGTTGTTACVGNDARLSDDRTASGLRSATTVVSVSAATAPTIGQVLTATSGTAATWQDAAGGGGGAPDDAAYLTNGAVAGLSAEVNIQALSSALAFTITDASPANDVTDVLKLVHMTSGAELAGIAAGLMFQAQNASDAAANAARVSGALTTLTAGAENGALDFWVNVAGTMTKRARLWADGGLSLGNLTAVPNPGICIPNGGSYWIRDSGGDASRVVHHTGGDNYFGISSAGSVFGGSYIDLNSNSSVNLYAIGMLLARCVGDRLETRAGLAHKKRNSADTNITVASDDHILAFSSLTAARTVTLPAPGSSGATATSPRIYEVKDESGNCDGTNTITLSVSGGANIDGAATLVINTAYGIARVYDNATQYFTKP